jgi:pimeloyl-ACP methyl ester carboxylesterase
MQDDESIPFTHRVTSSGPARGMTFTGRRRKSASGGNDDVPLVIALHGGGYTSAYFDIPCYSLLDRAERLGIPIIAIDRPGYGGTSPGPSAGSVFAQNAELIDHLIAEIWEANAGNARGVFLIGHSMGAVVSLAIAARRPEWNLLGIAVSGGLIRVPDDFTDRYAQDPGPTVEPPAELKAAAMFGPDWTRRSDMPEASYSANVPALKSEMMEVASGWPNMFHEIAPRIAVPVHLRHGEFDDLWLHQVPEFAANLSGSARVDAEMYPAAGHVIDYHRTGAAFQVQQLAFALQCAAFEPNISGTA